MPDIRFLALVAIFAGSAVMYYWFLWKLLWRLRRDHPGLDEELGQPQFYEVNGMIPGRAHIPFRFAIFMLSRKLWKSDDPLLRRLGAATLATFAAIIATWLTGFYLVVTSDR